MDSVKIAGIKIDNVTMEESIRFIDQCIRKKSSVHIVTPNVDHIVRLQRDKEFQEIYKKADLVLADGMPLLWAAKFLGMPFKEKISGSDLFPKLCQNAADQGHRLFLLGGRSGAVEKCSEILKENYPNIHISGVYSPAFGFENDECENEKIIKLIKKSNPDILCVGLGSPKQEKWIYRHRNDLNVPVAIGIGITFEYTAGIVKRAPTWMQQNGLEWLWRLLMEPSRLWKRYLVDDLPFFYLIVKQKFRSKGENI